MVGLNTIVMNEATLTEALEDYLHKQLGFTRVKVTDVQLDNENPEAIASVTFEPVKATATAKPEDVARIQRPA